MDDGMKIMKEKEDGGERREGGGKEGRREGGGREGGRGLSWLTVGEEGNIDQVEVRGLRQNDTETARPENQRPYNLYNSVYQCGTLVYPSISVWYSCIPQYISMVLLYTSVYQCGTLVVYLLLT